MPHMLPIKAHGYGGCAHQWVCLLFCCSDVWREVAGNVLRHHADLRSSVHIRRNQWLPVHLLQVSLCSVCPHAALLQCSCWRAVWHFGLQVVFLWSQRGSPAQPARHDPLQELHAHPGLAGLRMYKLILITVLCLSQMMHLYFLNLFVSFCYLLSLSLISNLSWKIVENVAGDSVQPAAMTTTFITWPACFSVRCHNRHPLHRRNTQPDQLRLLHQLSVVRRHHRRFAVLPLEETQPVPTHQGTKSLLLTPISSFTFSFF